MASADSPAAFTADTKMLIYHRGGRRCDRCGLRIMDGVHFHHRLPRRSGGSSNPRLGLPSNGLALHPACHDYVEKHRKVSAQLGFILGAMQEPVDVPIYRWDGWVWLNDDGTITRYPGVPPLHGALPNPDGRTGDERGRGPQDPADGDDEADTTGRS